MKCSIQFNKLNLFDFQCVSFSQKMLANFLFNVVFGHFYAYWLLTVAVFY